MMMALLFCTLPLHSPLLPSLGNSIPNNKTLIRRRRPSSSPSFSCMSSSSSSSSDFPTQKGPATNPFLDHPPSNSNYMLTRTTDSTTAASNAVVPRTPESTIERVIFDSRFLAILAVGGSLAGSLLCFLNRSFDVGGGKAERLRSIAEARRSGFDYRWQPRRGGESRRRRRRLRTSSAEGCIYIVDAYKVYWTSCAKGVHTGHMVLRLVEAIDVYLAGTVMLIFGMGLYGLFISNVPPEISPKVDRALRGSSLFGMFALKERPKWMKISSLDELKTKVGHVIVMILLVKMFERSKMVVIATGMDLLSYSVCIFLSSASLYILHNLHKGD